MNEFRWAAARLGFYAYIGFAMLTVVGGFVTAPLMTWYIFGDWRFWKHVNPGWKLFFHGWKMAGLILKGDNGGFILSVPLTSPPYKAPLGDVAYLSSSWAHGSSCGTCMNCCALIKCPVLDEKSGLCRGYDSFFWRYFNCGRFPVQQSEIDYFACPKWLIIPSHDEVEPERQAAMEALPAAANE